MSSHTTPGPPPSLIPRRTSVSSGSAVNHGLNRSTGSNASGMLSVAGLPLPSSSAMSSRTLGKRTSGQAGLSLHTPSTAKRPASSLSYSQSVPSTPPSSIAALRADLQASASAGALQRQLTSSHRENASLQRQVGSLQERVKQLERERSILLDRQEKASSRDVEREHRQEEQLVELTSSLKEFRQRCSTLQEERDELVNRSNRSNHAAELAREEKESVLKQMDVLQQELQTVDEENQKLKLARDELSTARETIQQMRGQLAALQSSSERAEAIKAESSSNSSVSDVLRKELHHQVTHLRTLEHNNARLTREVAALKAERANVELLKEEKIGLETKLRGMGTLRNKLAQAESECQVLKRERDEWAVFLAKDNGPAEGGDGDQSAVGKQSVAYTSPADVAKTLASTRIEVLSLRDKLGTVTAQVHARDETIRELEEKLRELEEDTIPALEQEREAALAKVVSLERSQALDLKELQMLREQIDTYATEEASLLRKPSDDAEQAEVAYDSQKTLQIAHLEELLAAHKAESARNAKEAERLRGMLEARGDDTGKLDGSESIAASPSKRSRERMGGSLHQQIKLNEELQETLRVTQGELAELQLDIESLEAHIDTLNHALGRGEYNADTTKVVSLTGNPAAQDLAVRTETLDRLKEENRVLLEKLGEMEKTAAMLSATASTGGNPELTKATESVDGAGPAALPHIEESVPKASFDNLQAEKEALLLQIEQASKSRSRLKDVFLQTAKNMRDACRSLFGYHLEPLDGGRFKVVTVFGGEEYSLIFGPVPGVSQSKSASKYQLVGGNDKFVMSPRVQTGVTFWIAERGCIPGFLSTLTMELYEETTKGRTAGYVEG